MKKKPVKPVKVSKFTRFSARMPSARLTMPQVREIRERYAAGGVTQKELAKEYGISPTQVNHLINHKTYEEWRE
jgi:DNA-binding MarR family transcriptional regulator